MPNVVMESTPHLRERLASKMVTANREVALDLLVDHREEGRQRIVGYVITTTDGSYDATAGPALRNINVTSSECVQSFLEAYTRFKASK